MSFSKDEMRSAGSAVCERCGHAFACNAGGDCWCAAESYRLPMPRDGSGCFCPDCLRKAASEQAAS